MMVWGRSSTSPRAIPSAHARAADAVIRFGKKAEERLIPVRLGARSPKWPSKVVRIEVATIANLQFELRKKPRRRLRNASRGGGSEDALKASLEWIAQSLLGERKAPVARR